LLCTCLTRLQNKEKKKKKRKASDDLPRHASLCTPRQSQADSVAARRSIADTSDISDCEVAPTPYRLGSPWTSAASPVLRDLCGARTWERISVSHPHYGHPYPCRHWDEQSASHRGRIQTKRRLLNLPDEMIEYIASFFPPVRWRSREVNSLQMLAAASARLQRLILPLYWKVRRILIAPLLSRERTTNTR
jgi:hypothetical protein